MKQESNTLLPRGLSWAYHRGLLMYLLSQSHVPFISSRNISGYRGGPLVSFQGSATISMEEMIFLFGQTGISENISVQAGYVR